MLTRDLPTTTNPPDSPQRSSVNLPDPDPMRRSYEVAQRSPVTWSAAPDPEARQQLIEFHREAVEGGLALPAAFADGPPPAELVTPPEALTGSVVSLLTELAEHFGLPFAPSSASAVLGRYGPGSGTGWHLDADDDSPKSADRTVSFSLLLNDDFEGGELEIAPTGFVEMQAGDLVGFTSRTWHRVAPVVSGERYAIIAFGGFSGSEVA